MRATVTRTPRNHLRQEPAPAAERVRIAILEDNASMCTLLRRILEQSYSVLFASSGSDLCNLVSKSAVRLVILDIGLPGESGITIAKDIRSVSRVPIVFISGNASASMIVNGLNVGGDDYVTKPFQSAVLLARVASALRRAGSWAQTFDPVEEPIQIGESSLDSRRRMLRHPGGPATPLTETECRLLAVLARQANQTISRADLTRSIYGPDWNPSSRSLDVHLTHLRQKLRQVRCENHTIASIRGVGFRLDLDSSTTAHAGARQVRAPRPDSELK